MLVCDRCGKTIINNSYSFSPFVYQTEGAGVWHKVDLCRDCKNELDEYQKRVESYFMVHKGNPRDIFNSVKYWGNLHERYWGNLHER